MKREQNSRYAEHNGLMSLSGNMRRAALDRDTLYPGIITWAEAHYIRIIFQRVVNDPTIVGVHRLKFDRPPRDTNRFGYLPNFLAQPVVAHCAPMRHVYLDSGRISVGTLEHAI